jgi:hypothetical protein
MIEYLTGKYLFKIAIVIIGIIYMALYYKQSLNRRYSLVEKDEIAIIDNRTGIIYIPNYKGENKTIMILYQVNGTYRNIPLKRLP